MVAKKAKKQRNGFDEMNNKLDRVIDTVVTHDDLSAFEERLEQKIDKRIGEVMTAIDGLTKVIHKLSVEYAAISVQLTRHDEWIKLLAAKAGIKLPV